MNTPIGDQVESMLGSEEDQEGLVRITRPEESFVSEPSEDAGEKMPDEEEHSVVSIVSAQSRFIKAQFAFYHDKNLAAFAGAQEVYILALTNYLEQVGGF